MAPGYYNSQTEWNKNIQTGYITRTGTLIWNSDSTNPYIDSYGNYQPQCSQEPVEDEDVPLIDLLVEKLMKNKSDKLIAALRIKVKEFKL